MAGRLAGCGARAEDCGSMTAVIVLHAVLDAQTWRAADSRLLERLPYAKRLELEARDPAARLAGLRGIGLVQRGAARISGRDAVVADLCFPMGGKPQLRDGPVFSISHTAHRVAVALAANGALGLDLEDLAIEGGGPGADRSRLDQWTATEAVLKAAGRGLRAAPDVEVDTANRVAMLAGRIYVLTPLTIAPDVVAHLATDGLPTAVELERVDLDG
jgi:phosphopantetheinyl transferase